jgi:hypothetical protein
MSTSSIPAVKRLSSEKRSPMIPTGIVGTEQVRCRITSDHGRNPARRRYLVGVDVEKDELDEITDEATRPEA